MTGGATYPDEYFTARESWRDWQIEARNLIRLARVTAGTRVLEIGCGGGGLLRLLADAGARPVGVDTLGNALQLARRRWTHDENWSLVEIDRRSVLPFASGRFDAIIGQHVLEHLADVATALDEYWRLLAPGGRLAHITPNILYPDPAHFDDGDHVHLFAPDELKTVLVRGGWSIEHCTTLFPYLSHARLLRAAGVFAYRAFERAPYFDKHGRSILVAALKPHSPRR